MNAQSLDEAWDVLHAPGPAGTHWCTDNIGEATPGVVTPLNCSIWTAASDQATREIGRRMGFLSRRECQELQPISRPVYGRVALLAEYFAAIGDRMPGTSGQDAVRSLFGRVPETMTFAPTRARYPFIACRMPVTMLTTPRAIRAVTTETDAWWRTQIARLPHLDVEDTRAVLVRAAERFRETLTVHSVGLFAVVQPLLVGLTKIVEQAGTGDVGLLSGSGGAEMAIISDIWKASRGELTVDDVIANHGFHGPLEGEISSRVWREDPAPLEGLILKYTALDESEDPRSRAARAQARVPEVHQEVVAALPRAQRLPARLLLHEAARLLPIRGVGKRAFLQSLDVARAAARRLGEQWELDTFQFTVAELVAGLPPDAAALAERRRERRAYYQTITIPGNWRGIPEVSTNVNAVLDKDIIGTGVSAGVVEGTVRVVTDPSFAEVENDEILVTPTTDPSWASIMFMSSALVVDIGGALSHAAVVARELGIPCVVNTRNGSRVLQTGDRVRVNGTSGVVEVLARCGESR